MRNNWRNSLVTALLASLLLLGCNSGEHAGHTDTYTCPMHPTVLSDKPGSCPVCGLSLVAKVREGQEVKITEDLAKLIKSTNEVVVAGIKTTKATYGSRPLSITAGGLVTYDTRNIYTIPAKVGGRLEKVFLKYQFQPVRKGQKVAEIYSPELVTAQREFLYILENDPANTALIEASRNKLLFFGLTQGQLSEIAKRKEVTNTFVIYSPYNGFVVTDAAPVLTSANSNASPMPGAMSASRDASASPVSSSPSQLIRAGNYVTTGETLFKIVDNSSLLIELNLPLTQAGSIKVKDQFQFDAGNGNANKGRVHSIQPFFDNGEDFVKIRAYINQSNDVRIGQLIQATFSKQSDEALWVPKAAVLDLGMEKVIFVKENKVFSPRRVETGIESDNSIEIRRGLASSDEVAVNAQYLVDSESFIKSKKK